MLSFKKANKLAEFWIDMMTGGICKICLIQDKPYGWVFFYDYKNFDPNDASTLIAGNVPIIVDRVTREVRITGIPAEKYIKAYEATLPEAVMAMTPERHDGTKKYQ